MAFKNIWLSVCLFGGFAASAQTLTPTVTVKPPKGAAQTRLIPGSTSIIVPDRMLKPATRGSLSHYDELRLFQTEKQARTTKHFLSPSGEDADSGVDALAFGHRENKNDRKVKITVNLGSRQATITSPDVQNRTMRIATGMPSHSTARFIGCFDVKHTNPNHKSREYNGAPMNNASFFVQTSGIALHEGNLGGQSHGCVRLSAEDSRFVMNQIRKHSKKVYDPYLGREKIVYDAEVCVERGGGAVAKKSPAKKAAGPVAVRQAPRSLEAPQATR